MGQPAAGNESAFAVGLTGFAAGLANCLFISRGADLSLYRRTTNMKKNTYNRYHLIAIVALPWLCLVLLVSGNLLNIYFVHHKFLERRHEVEVTEEIQEIIQYIQENGETPLRTTNLPDSSPFLPRPPDPAGPQMRGWTYVRSSEYHCHISTPGRNRNKLLCSIEYDPKNNIIILAWMLSGAVLEIHELPGLNLDGQ